MEMYVILKGKLNQKGKNTCGFEKNVLLLSIYIYLRSKQKSVTYESEDKKGIRNGKINSFQSTYGIINIPLYVTWK